ncbi:Polyprenol reductase [Frankliniella fusca]|uniref:Polyprenal reductase n=1 Tax=Frankliniella fusca TaxID=407009 RepID=A0AAE1LNV4_9NEOP|nr:Polyprenol reductase [Frankliniella fusca]
MELHILKVLFASMTTLIAIFGSLLNTVEKHLPTFIRQSYRFGKFSYEGKKDALVLEVPKRWFSHFYVFAALYSMMCLVFTLKVYVFGGAPPTKFIQLLNILATEKRTFTVSSLATLIGLTLMTAQCMRRFYETWFISVFSDAKMNFSHYIVGFLHYFGAINAILVEAPGFTSHTGVSSLVLRLNFSELHYYHYLAIVSFVWAFVHQYRAAIILADLRRDTTGKVVSQAYRLPEGDLFNLVSSPHMLCEVVMYFSLLNILWGSSVFPYVTVWVLSNQVENALLTHWWYQEKFKEYPRERRAIFPFIL